MIPFIQNVQNRQICRDRKQIRACLGLGSVEFGWEGTANGYRVSLGDDENVLKLTVVRISQLCNCIKNH